MQNYGLEPHNRTHGIVQQYPSKPFQLPNRHLVVALQAMMVMFLALLRPFTSTLIALVPNMLPRLIVILSPIGPEKPASTGNRIESTKPSIFHIWRLKYCLPLGLGVILLLSGCANKGGAYRNLTKNPPTQSTGLSSQNVGEVQDTAKDGEDGFFEEEFSTDYSLGADPLAPINRAIFQFNDKLYFWCLKPIAKGYRKVIPEPVRLSIGNLFYNIAGVGRMANNLLQGKFWAAGGELGRFFVNSTAGLLGLGNPAANFPALNPENEDMGQTLGSYGIGEGIYLVLPVLGPSTLRDTVGLVGDFIFDPVSYLQPWYVPISTRVVNITNQLSFRIGDFEALKGAALDPYLMFRSAYIQNRRRMVEQ